jgi:hypothetical protein
MDSNKDIKLISSEINENVNEKFPYTSDGSMGK